MRHRNTNRHGIPTYPSNRPAQLPRCCWPKCENRVGSRMPPPLCDKHVYEVYDIVVNSRYYMAAINASKAAQVEYATETTPQEDKPKPPTKGTIYFLRSGPHIKIGWTSNLNKRMRAHAPDSVLLATCPGTRKDENRLHRRFAVHRTHGREWYALVPPLLEHIKGVVRDHGEPPEVQFAAKPVEIRRPHEQRQGPRPRGWARHVA